MAEETYSSTHPLLPPTTEDDRIDWLRLLRSRRVGVSTFYRLMREHGSAAAALEALPGIAAAAGVDNYQLCPMGVVHAELKAARAAGARMICRGEPGYPDALAELDDAPPILWCVGDPAILRRPMVALVGARNASSLGTRMARRLAQELSAAGYVVVSGLARGVDTVVHLASLDGGTVAVLGGGVDVLYPSENTRLAEEIVAKGGARLSEQPMGLQPQARHFPARNRIISGLARAVVVVEAAAKSGSLITARAALDQGREVLAVPGHPFDARAGGCNILIRDGATLVRHADDVIEALGPVDLPAQADLPLAPAARREPVAEPISADQARLWAEHTPPPPSPQRPDARTLSETAKLHGLILDRLGPSPLAEDQLIRDLGVATSVVAPALTELELDGLIARQSGGLLARLT